MKIIFAFPVSILLNHPNSQFVSRDTVTAANVSRSLFPFPRGRKDA